MTENLSHWGEIGQEPSSLRSFQIGHNVGLVPFWIYPMEGGAKIERQIRGFPLIQELSRLSALRRAVAVYRMVSVTET
jgi:hypothetical protein